MPVAKPATSTTEPASPSDPAFVAVLYRPELIGRTNPQIFYAPKHEAAHISNPKFQGQALEVEQVLLTRGSQILNYGIWKKIETYEPNQKEIANFKKRGVIRLIFPTAETPNSTTLDYDPADAIDLIQASPDMEWLKRCQSLEVQRTDVWQAIRDRLAEIEELTRQRMGSGQKVYDNGVPTSRASF